MRARLEARIRRLKRVLGEGREDVGQEQLLMLLLVIDAELDQFERVVGQAGQRPRERLVDMGALGAHLVQRRAAASCRAGRGHAARPRLRNRC